MKLEGGHEGMLLVSLLHRDLTQMRSPDSPVTR
jgi:hypothetical protein